MQCRLNAMADSKRVSDTLPKKGKVTQVCKEWLVHEDGALAYALQKQEMEKHYHGNKWRNAVVREDFPLALNEQRKEEEAAMLRYRQHVQTMHDKDEELARDLALRLHAEEEEDIRKKTELDRKLALRMQVKEETTSGDINTVGLPVSSSIPQAHTSDSRVATPSGDDEDDAPALPPRRSSPQNNALRLPPKLATPFRPPPYNSGKELTDGLSIEEIVPEEEREIPRVNDEKINLTFSRPHPTSDRSVISPQDKENHSLESRVSDVDRPGPSREETSWPPPPSTPELDRHRQELQDQEIARKLQEELESEADTVERDHLLAMEVQDMELAKMLQDKEKARAKRAREKAKAKALAKRQEQAAQSTRVKKDDENDEESVNTNGQVELIPNSDEANQFPCISAKHVGTAVESISSSASSVLHPVGGPVPNIAAAIDPTFSSERQPNRTHGSPTSHESVELDDDSGLPYFPVQGQKRTSSLDKKRRKDKNKDSSCKQQ